MMLSHEAEGYTTTSRHLTAAELTEQVTFGEPALPV